MIKKSLAVLSIAAAFYAQAQDASIIKNSVEIYSNSSTTGSSKFNAMAGSMGALGGDVSVMNTNPAGIGVAIAADLSGTLNVNSSTNTTSLGGNSLDYKINSTDLGQIGGIAVFKISKNSPWKFVNLGFNYSSKSIEDYSETPRNSNITFDLPNEQLSFAGHAYNRLGDLTKLNIGVGGNYDNRIYVGAGINVHGVTINQDDSAAMTFSSDNAIEVFNKQYTPYYEEASGFSASVGVIGKVNNQFRLGAALETPTWWGIDRLYEFYGYDGNDDAQYRETRNFASPMKATVSAAFVPNKSLALNVDYSLGLSKPKYTDMDGAAKEEFNDFMSTNYKNLSEVKVGAEYRIEQFRLRAGYAFATSPFDNITMNAYNANGVSGSTGFDNLFVGQRNTVGVGIGYDFKTFYLDAAYQNISSTYNSPFLRGSETAGTEYYSPSAYFANNSAVVSQVDNKQNNFTVTLGWKF